MNIETRLQKLEKSTPKTNSMSNLSDKELQSEFNRIVALLKELDEIGELTTDEIAEVNRVLHRMELLDEWPPYQNGKATPLLMDN
ncbi:MAG: hypothetical protein PHO08_13000 [Methylococcales bacterium]|nr:hypothetical protein [Methylococcales bacterium]MDD5631930.1 hypothetical protein [Methylococcales bacterium]